MDCSLCSVYADLHNVRAYACTGVYINSEVRWMNVDISLVSSADGVGHVTAVDMDVYIINAHTRVFIQRSARGCCWSTGEILMTALSLDT